MPGYIGPGQLGAMRAGMVNSGQTGTAVAPYAMDFPVNVATLPQPGQTPTGPTGVASSQLATDTLNTQRQGFDALNTSVQNHAATKAATPTYNPEVSIVDFLTSKGVSSDYNSRSQLAKTFGINDYVGTPDQNTRLIALMNGGGSTTSGATGTTPANGTTTQTGNTTGSTTTTDANGTPNQPTTGSPGDVYSPALQAIQGEIGTALDTWKQQTSQILNGTFPLTPYQQSQIDATQAKFDSIAQQQLIANKAYENQTALAGNRLGLNVQNPQEYFAEHQKAISDGLTKINNLDATATKTIADLHQSFMDKDYDMINKNYDTLQTTLNEKSKSIQDLQDRTDKLYTDTRDYNLKVKEYQMNLEKSRVEIAKLQSDIAKNQGTSSLLNSGFGQQIQTAMAGIRFPSVDERNVATTAIANLVAQGNIQGAQDQLKQYAFNSMPASEQIVLTNKDDSIKALDRIQTGLDQLEKAGIDTNLFSGFSQKTLQRGGFLQDPTLNAVAEDIALAIIDYRHAATGAAFTSSEAKTYDRLFPSTGNVPALNSVLIKTLRNKFESDIDNKYNQRISNYEQVNGALDNYKNNPGGLEGSGGSYDPAGVL